MSLKLAAFISDSICFFTFSILGLINNLTKPGMHNAMATTEISPTPTKKTRNT